MPLPHNRIWIRSPELLVPMRKPRGILRYNPESRIPKDILLPLDSWQQVGNTETTPMVRNIGRRKDIQPYISMNHAGPYEHWFPDDGGIKNEYGSTYINAEAIWENTGGEVFRVYPQETYIAGAVWTCHRDDISGSSIDYFLIGSNLTTPTAGHANLSYAGIKPTGTNGINVIGNARPVVFSSLPSLIVPGKTYSVVAKCWFGAASYTHAKLWINGVYYGEQTSASTSGGDYTQPKLTAVTSGSSHHNRVLDGIVHMVWAMAGDIPDDVCRQESFDPFQTVLPA